MESMLLPPFEPFEHLRTHFPVESMIHLQGGLFSLPSSGIVPVEADGAASEVVMVSTSIMASMALAMVTSSTTMSLLAPGWPEPFSFSSLAAALGLDQNSFLQLTTAHCLPASCGHQQPPGSQLSRQYCSKALPLFSSRPWRLAKLSLRTDNLCIGCTDGEVLGIVGLSLTRA